MDLNDAELNEEFTRELRKFELVAARFNLRQRATSTEWVTKLKATSSTPEDKKLRNLFLKYFVSYSNDGGIFDIPPFSCVPPGRALKNFRHLLPRELLEEEHYQPQLGSTSQQPILEMFEQLTDQEARLFLSDQPVPREGTIFIIIMQPASIA